VTNDPLSLSPSASFVVERECGKGYQVTSAEGAHADECKGRALALLDALGQPDPKGPEEYFRWFGPIKPAGECVGVSVKLLPNGEVRCHQAWFLLPKAAPSRRHPVVLFACVLLAGLIVGALLGRILFVQDRETLPGPPLGNGSPVKDKRDPPPKDTPPDIGTAQLKVELASSRNLRAKLRKYLSQEGFAADRSNAVTDEKRSVKLIADLDKTPPPQETILLSNIEVTRLLVLLEKLEDLATSSIPSSKSERP